MAVWEFKKFLGVLGAKEGRTGPKRAQLAGGGWLEMGVSTVFMSAWVE